MKLAPAILVSVALCCGGCLLWNWGTLSLSESPGTTVLTSTGHVGGITLGGLEAGKIVTTFTMHGIKDAYRDGEVEVINEGDKETFHGEIAFDRKSQKVTITGFDMIFPSGTYHYKLGKSLEPASGLPSR